ncbi:MAG TPA: methylenetetrahydrofolate reductase C-terminal domain-containing protein [Anaerolineae bacterium]|nr:methylenetetrahydrofolate reductase C-terminal domain-containing protein [Anaerolineae bacterium]
MIVTEKKPITEILESLGEEKNIFLLACNGCAEVCETGGETAVLAMKEELEKAGISITGQAVIDFLCNKVLVNMRLSRYANTLEKADAVLVLTCGIGVQAVATVVEKVIHPALNTISLGGFQGLWPSAERCEQCGDCVLDMTGGICPVTSCTKGLLNGPCGGSSEGKCEVDPERDCGWEKIYYRLKTLGRIENLKKYRKPRDYNKMLTSPELRTTPFYDMEQV